MTEYAFDPPPVVSAPVADEAVRLPVRRIFCVGRNYGAHVKEMGGDAKDQPPVFFTKPADAVVVDGAPVAYPPATRDLHHEIELVIALRSGGAGIPVERALSCVFGYAAGVDLTRRDLQGLAKKAAQPWDAAKAFDASAPLGPIRRMEGAAPPEDARIHLAVDGAVKQDGRLSDMIWSAPEILAEDSKLWTLEAGDLIFTGTPEGVGPIARGQRVEGGVDGVGAIAFSVA